jgi:hypothetical protein
MFFRKLQFFGIAIGLIVFVLAYLYNCKKITDDWKEVMEGKYNALIAMWTGNEKHDIEAIAKGEEVG